MLLLTAINLNAESRYKEALNSEVYSGSIKNLAVSMLKLPYKSKEIIEQIKHYFWYNQTDIKISEAKRELEDSNFRASLNKIAKVVKENDVRKMYFIGFSFVGTKHFVDFYFSMVTNEGPAIIRISMKMEGKTKPKIYNYSLFQGWDQCRALIKEVEHDSGKDMVNVTLSPEFYKKLDQKEAI